MTSNGAKHRRSLVPDDVECDYCGVPAEFVTGAEVYLRRPDLHDKRFYKCRACDAWVGCHPGTSKPLGRLADFELRRAKQETHALFDTLWRAKMKTAGLTKGQARGKAYAWLAAALGIERKLCHIGMFDVETCRRAADLCRPYAELLMRT